MTDDERMQRAARIRQMREGSRNGHEQGDDEPDDPSNDDETTADSATDAELESDDSSDESADEEQPPRKTRPPATGSLYRSTPNRSHPTAKPPQSRTTK
ncbi:hypothetical protein VB779_03880 [Haloarculaceae archaeon H-GB11]|nr:hypothetical protein [Haloarculaceae archaeon H-GB11]